MPMPAAGWGRRKGFRGNGCDGLKSTDHPSLREKTKNAIL
jgi:hypothetical protein